MTARVRPLHVILTLLTLVALVLSTTSADAARKKKKKRVAQTAPAVYVEKSAAIVVDAQTGRVLFESMAHEKRYPASLTKMMTLYLLFEHIAAGKATLSTRMAVSAFAASQDPSKLGMEPGDTLSVEDAIKALIVRSANDVAVVVAEHIGGSEYRFAQLMTNKARDLGMTNTQFVNASGLPDESQRSTAFDLMLLSRRLIGDFSEYAPYFRLQSFTWAGRSYQGHNNLLKFFDGADGLKTGYTRMSGFNLASSATRKDKRLISVVMGGRTARERDTRTAQLLEAEFGKLGLGQPAPVLMAMSPLVLDEDEASNAAAGPASESRPADTAPATAPNSTSTPQIQTASMLPIADDNEPAQGDSEDPPARVAPKEAGLWGIQVGAHSSRENAETQRVTVRTQLQDLLSGAKDAIVPHNIQGTTVYRVRFGAFTPKKAERLCEQMQGRGVSCLVVTEAGWDQSGTQATRPIAVR
jgi:D-alanyl-D-alanine carboxypeptidase